MVVTCEIIFEQNAAGTYFNGQLVSGSVVLSVAKAIDVQAITVKIRGLAVTQWKERRFHRSSVFAGHEDYIAFDSYLLGSEEARKQTLHAGIHSYSFSCQIPTTCPSSFEGRYGYIRYVAKVAVIRADKADIGFARGFTVLKLVDLNCDTSTLDTPCSSETYRTFCCGPCITEPLKLELSVPQTGYVPGQSVSVSLLVINNSSIPVAEVDFSLVMLVRYFSQRPERHSRVQRVVVTRAKGDAVLRNCTRSITQQLHVPATPPTCMTDSVIQVAYQVEVEARMKNMHGSQVVTMPLIVGNVPLRSVVQVQPMANHEGFKAYEHGGEAYAPGASSSHTADNTAPPTYEESVHMVRADISQEDELQHDSGFTPLYPVFDIPSPTAPSIRADAGFQFDGYDNRNFQS